MNQPLFLLAAALTLSLACGGSATPPHDPRFDQCVKLGTYKIETTQTSASGSNCNVATQTYTSTLINTAEGVYTLKFYQVSPTLGCLLRVQIDPSDCSGSISGSDCSSLGIHFTGDWSFGSTGFSGSAAASWNFTSSNYCSESENLVGTLQ